MEPKTMLLVESNIQDEMLTLRALRKAKLDSHVDVTRDGRQAPDHLFRQDKFANRKGSGLPAVVLLDISPPRLTVRLSVPRRASL